MAGARGAIRGGTRAQTRGRRIRGLDAGERQAQRRRQLLDAALELFATKGYVYTSIEQICQTAFVGTKAFYELFDGKEACYLALLDEITQQIADKMVAALDDAPDDQQEASHALVAAFAHAVVDDPRVARASFGQAGGISPAVEDKRRANRRWAAQFVETAWSGFVDQPRRGSLHAVAVGVVAGMFDLVVAWLDEAGDADADIETLIEDLTTFYDTVQTGLANGN